MEEPMKLKLKIRNIISITVLNLIQIQNLDLSEYLLIDYSKLKNFPLFILQYTKKKTIKIIYIGNLFLHCLQIKKKSKKF